MPEEPTNVGLGLGETAAGLDAHRFAHEAMATVFEIVCAHDDRGYARQAAQAAFELVDRMELELSRFIANSDVSRINTLAAGEATRVSPETMGCLEISRGMFALTGGAFDISIGSGLERLDLVPDGFVVRAREDGVRLDLGGIGKGYAVDRMADLLDDWEIPRALLHGGFSSVLALDAPAGLEGWPLTLTVAGPADDSARIRLSARQMALSASGTQKGAHIQDPLAGRPVRDRAAWAALPCGPGPEAVANGEWGGLRSSAAVAEALSTAFMILPLGDIEELCRRLPGLEVWVLREVPGGGAPGGTLVHLGGPGPG